MRPTQLTDTITTYRKSKPRKMFNLTEMVWPLAVAVAMLYNYPATRNPEPAYLVRLSSSR
jgi:hypothetical protein